MKSIDRNLTMLCDFYELTMANGYLKSGIGEQYTYFDVLLIISRIFISMNATSATSAQRASSTRHFSNILRPSNSTEISGLYPREPSYFPASLLWW